MSDRFADDIDLDAEFPLPPGYEDMDGKSDPDYDVEHPPRRRAARAPEDRRPAPDMSRAPRPRDREPAKKRAEAPVPVMDEGLGIDVVTIEHDGMELTLPADPEDWPIDATYAFEQGKIISAVRAILSAEDFAKIIRKRYRNKEFGKLYEALAKAGGFETGGN